MTCNYGLCEEYIDGSHSNNVVRWTSWADAVVAAERVLHNDDAVKLVRVYRYTDGAGSCDLVSTVSHEHLYLEESDLRNYDK